MSDLRFNSIGNRNDGTAAVSGGTPVRALGTIAATAGRKAINVFNHSASYGIRVMLTENDTVPTISSTSKDDRIPPNDRRTYLAGATVRVWLISEDGSNTCAFTAVELGR